jgi:hypothetical protein
MPKQAHRLAGLKVRDLMTEEPITARPDWSLPRPGLERGAGTGLD